MVEARACHDGDDEAVAIVVFSAIPLLRTIVSSHARRQRGMSAALNQLQQISLRVSMCI